jgi:hypothetical protein
MVTLKKCKGITLKGNPCKLIVAGESNYCRFHQDEKQKVIDFITKHKTTVFAYLLGASTDSIVGDFYNYLKDQLGFQHFVPPILNNEVSITSDPRYIFSNHRQVFKFIFDINKIPPDIKNDPSIPTPDSIRQQCEKFYFPFYPNNPFYGILEIIFPTQHYFCGNINYGTFYIFLIHKESWIYLGEMEGQYLSADMEEDTTGFTVSYGGGSNTYKFDGNKYICVDTFSYPTEEH